MNWVQDQGDSRLNQDCRDQRLGTENTNAAQITEKKVEAGHDKQGIRTPFEHPVHHSQKGHDLGILVIWSAFLINKEHMKHALIIEHFNNYLFYFHFCQ